MFSCNLNDGRVRHTCVTLVQRILRDVGVISTKGSTGPARTGSSHDQYNTHANYCS